MIDQTANPETRTGQQLAERQCPQDRPSWDPEAEKQVPEAGLRVGALGSGPAGPPARVAGKETTVHAERPPEPGPCSRQAAALGPVSTGGWPRQGVFSA